MVKIQVNLAELESRSIYILREAFHFFSHPCIAWSMGKDSCVLLHLARKAAAGQLPCSVLHIDTTYEFPEMLDFRDWACAHYNFDLIVKINHAAREGLSPYTTPIGYDCCDPLTVTHELKTIPLHQVLAEKKFDALITGIRRDEDPTRAKERYFSPRNSEGRWDYRDQAPEFWDFFQRTRPSGGHIRIQPLLDWTELDIWHYILQENITIPPLYFAQRDCDGILRRYRSIGCSPITLPIPSTATTIPEIIAELEDTRSTERNGRTQDSHSPYAMQSLRARGFL